VGPPRYNHLFVVPYGTYLCGLLQKTKFHTEQALFSHPNTYSVLLLSCHFSFFDKTGGEVTLLRKIQLSEAFG
jgi:hypothetical protein